MVRTFSPLNESDVDDVGGRMVWTETETELCGVEIRGAGDESVQIGDIFAVSQGCYGETEMREAFENFGMPETACLFVRAGDTEDEYCAPLAIEDSGDRGP